MRTISYIKKYLETYPGPGHLKEFLEEIIKYFPDNIPYEFTDKYSEHFTAYINRLAFDFSFNLSHANFLLEWFRRP